MKAQEPRQLLLGLQLDDTATLENFLPAAGDAQVVQHLRDKLLSGGEQFTFIWGRAGSGKTHLLQALCHQLADGQFAPIYIPLSRAAALSPLMLEGLEELDLVCVDDIDAVAGQADWELALFNFYNQARDRQVKFVMSAMVPPNDLSIRLPDLRSRLQTGVVYQLHELSDSEKALLLERRAGQLGIRLPETVVNYVIQRHDRSVAALMGFLRELDRQSLEKKRRITIPLVREIMGW